MFLPFAVKVPMPEWTAEEFAAKRFADLVFTGCIWAAVSIFVLGFIMNAVLESKRASRHERDLRRRVRRMHEGKAVTIHPRDWNRFVEISEELRKVRQEWRVRFDVGKIEITRLDG